MKKSKGWVTPVVLALSLSTPLLLSAASKTKQPVSKHPETPKEVQKSSKQYNKQLRKDQKRQAKMAKKQAKANKKRRQGQTTTTHSVI